MAFPFSLGLLLCGLSAVIATANAGGYDYGDAPAGYGVARHTQPVTATVYLGTTPPDQETSSQTSTNADGDDDNGSDDEDALASLPNLSATDTSYTINVPCVGEGTVAGWVDFDHSGAFTNISPNEKASATCNNGTATLNWNSAGSNFPANLTVGPTFARLRIASAVQQGICQGKGLFGTGGITLNASSVNSYTDAYDPLNPGSSAQVGANGNIVVNGNGVIKGSATASGSISGTVTGTKTTGAPVTSFAAVAACSPYSGTSGISSDKGKFPYDPVTGNLSVSGGATLTLAPGAYCFNSVKMSGNSILNITGPTTLYLKGDGDFSGGTIANATLNPDNLRILSMNALKLTGGTQAYASVYAPNSPLTISGSGNFYGCAVAGAVTLSGGTTFHQDLGLVGLGVGYPTGGASDGEVEDYSLRIADGSTRPSGFGDSCTGHFSGDVGETVPAIPLQINAGNQVFVASRSTSTANEGHLKAYAVQADGSVATSAAWDAAALMYTTARQNGLYSTGAAGAKILFSSLDDAAFSSTTPSVATIKSYTFDPSYGSGTYLAGRRSGSYLGSISRGDGLALITQAINLSLYLSDPAYRAFYGGTVASRSEKVLAASDDGFLYAFNQADGTLAWGWMPRSLAKELKNYASFQGSYFMRGKEDVIDVKDASGNYATFVVGGYKNGLGHYVLKLSATGGLDSVVWDEDRSSGANTAPNQGEMGYFSDGAGQTWATYAVTDSSGLSTLVIRNILTTDTTEVALDFNATSTPFVMPDFGDANGPARKTLYLGDSSGNIRRAALLDVNGSLNSASILQTALQSTTYSGTLAAAEPILFLGASVSASDRKYYLRAQSKNRLTVLQYNSSTTNWTKRWTSYVGGAGFWDAAGTTYAADNSGAPTADSNGDGFDTTVTANGIQSLPTGAVISDAAQIVADSVILPVSATAIGACYGKAYYYAYRLTDGAFPDNKFYSPSNVAYVGDLVLGYGQPTRVTISDMPSKDQMRGQGGTDQLPNGTTGVTPPFFINDGVSTGIRGWTEM